MTGMLASVTSIEEAALVLAEGVDIIDLKQPALGALGALEISLVKRIVEFVDGQCPVSATIGDLPMQPEPVLAAVKAVGETGIDFIKIGFFPGNDWLGTAAALKLYAQQNEQALIAVLFADAGISFNMIDAFKSAGFKGVMIDTMNKKNGSLTEIMISTEIARFVQQAKNNQLICGLAGSLRPEDITALKSFQPDYLGFRGALCSDNNRQSGLSREAVVRVKRAVYS